MTLTKQDFDAMKDLIEVTIDDKIEEKKLVTKTDLSHLPTKDEFYEQTDKIMAELKAIREEHTVSAHHISNHEDRLQIVEKKLSISL